MSKVVDCLSILSIVLPETKQSMGSIVSILWIDNTMNIIYRAIDGIDGFGIIDRSVADCCATLERST